LVTPAGVVIFWIQIQDETRQHITVAPCAELRVNLTKGKAAFPTLCNSKQAAGELKG